MASRFNVRVVSRFGIRRPQPPHGRTVALSFYKTWYNFVRQHKTPWCSPAMAAGLAGTLWSMEDVVALIDAQAEPAKKRGPCTARTARAA